MRRLIEAIQRVLHPLWNDRVPGVIAKAETFEGEDPRDVYVQAYKDAYFAAVEDLLSTGLVQYPSGWVLASGSGVLHSEEVH